MAPTPINPPRPGAWARPKRHWRQWHRLDIRSMQFVKGRDLCVRQATKKDERTAQRGRLLACTYRGDQLLLFLFR